MATTQQVSDHPPAGAVTHPTDPQVKKQDIERKMKFYAVIDGLRQGKMPTNKQIDENMRYALTHSPIDQSKLSKEGKELVKDFQSLIETARQMVMQKNQDELFQKFLWATRETDNSKINPGKHVDTPVNKEQAKSEGDEALQHLKTLGKLIITNGEFRKVCKDISLLSREVAVDAATKVADKARPDEEAMQHVDEPAPENQWEDYDKAMEPVRKAKDTASKVNKTAQDKKEQAADEANKTAQDDERAQAHRQRLEALANDVQDPQRREELRREARQAISDRVPDSTKEKAKDTKNKTINYAKEKFPEERRDRFIYRLKKIVYECQQQSDYQEATEFVFNLAETYKARGQSDKDQLQGHVKENVWKDPAFKEAFDDMRTLLERFANGQSLQPIFDATDDIYTEVANDPELKTWFTWFGKWFRRTLQEPGFVMTEDCDEEARRLRSDGKGFFSERYRPHRERWTNAVEHWFRAYADDPLNVQFGEDVKRLTKQLALDSEGKMTYKPHLWQDVRGVVLPELLGQIGYVPIPRIEYTDKAVDLVIENLTIEAANMLPNIVEMEARNFFKLSPYKSVSNANKHNFEIDFKQVQCDLKDVAFFYKKKSGFPRMSDSGLADVLIGGEGLCGKIHLSSSSDKHRVFDIHSVNVSMHQFKFKIRDAAKHQMLYSIMGPLATTVIKAAVPRAIEQAIRNGLEELNRQLVDINERLDEAGESEEQSKADVIKDMFKRKGESAEEKGQAAKQKADQRNSQFKVVLREEDRILDWESKQSMVARQGNAQKEIQSQQKSWQSDIFDATVRPVQMP